MGQKLIRHGEVIHSSLIHRAFATNRNKGPGQGPGESEGEGEGQGQGHDLFAIPIVATINDSTKNRNLLTEDDWLGNVGNRVLVTCPPRVST